MASRKPRSARSALWPLEPVQPPAPPAISPQLSEASLRQAILTRRLHALADAASGYLRFHPDRSVRRAMALLAAATLAASAACGPASDAAFDENAIVAVEKAMPQANAGFPTAAGNYELRPKSLQMDTGGTYYFWWYTSGSGGAINLARGSNVQLVEDDRTFLQVESGNSQVLHIKSDEPLALVAPGEAGMAQTAAPVAGQQVGGYGMGPALWYPFFLMGGTGGFSRTPGYYAPPSGDVQPGGQVQGSTRSVAAPTSAPSFTLKTTAVSGRAGGTGSGSAATSKSGVAAPRASGFSAGTGSSAGSAGS